MDGELREFLASQLLRISTEMRRKPPVERRGPERTWTPAEAGHEPCKVQWVRPEIATLFPDAAVREPGRSPRSQSRGWQTRYFSQKAGRVIRGASHLEGQHVVDTDFDREVACVCEQPMSLKLPDGRTVRPDAFVWMRQGPHEIREVKLEREAVLAEERWDAIGTAVAAMGYTYRVVTDRRMGHPDRTANVELFMAHRHAEVPNDATLDAMWRTLGSGGMAAGEFLAAHPGTSRKQLFALLRLTFIALDDLDVPFGDDSPIQRFRRDIRRVGAAFRSDCGSPPVPGSIHFARVQE